MWAFALMKTNKPKRLVVINHQAKTILVYEDRVVLAEYVIENNYVPTAEDIEEIRLADYKAKA